MPRGPLSWLILLVALGGCSENSVQRLPTTTSASVKSPVRIAHRVAHPRIRRDTSMGVEVLSGQSLATVSPQILGAGMPVWYNITIPGIANAFTTAGMEATRWPGGKAANWYHWETNSSGPNPCNGNPNQYSTFDNFMQNVVIPANLSLAVTVNYGSNAACTAGGDPSEAANWVAYANATQNYNVQWWTVGNEQYAAGSLDLHSEPHSPTQYAQIESTQFYPAMKAASPTPINVCVGVDPKRKKLPSWDSIVLSQALYDCVEMHFYAQSPQDISDSYLLTQAVPTLHGYLMNLKSELATAGNPNTPIYLGEIGSSTAPVGKQGLSIVQALFAGMVIGELVNDGVARETWHLGDGDCTLPSSGGDFSPSIYGWQDWGGAEIFADQEQDGCPAEYVPAETLLPTAVAYQVLSNFAHANETALATAVTSMPDIQAYAATDAGGYAVMLFNLNETTTEDVPVTIDGLNGGSGGTITSYDKDLYDESQNDVWAGPATAPLGSWSSESFTISMPPWSMAVVQTQSADRRKSKPPMSTTLLREPLAALPQK
jgi:hypothetical protein